MERTENKNSTRAPVQRPAELTLSELQHGRSAVDEQASAATVAEDAIRGHISSLSKSEVLELAEVRIQVSTQSSDSPDCSEIAALADQCRVAEENFKQLAIQMARRAREGLSQRTSEFDTEALKSCRHLLREISDRHCKQVLPSDDQEEPRADRNDDTEPRGQNDTPPKEQGRNLFTEPDSKSTGVKSSVELSPEAAAIEREALRTEIDDLVVVILNEVDGKEGSGRDLYSAFAEFLLDWGILNEKDHTTLEKGYKALNDSFEQLRKQLSKNLIETARSQSERTRREEQARAGENTQSQPLAVAREGVSSAGLASDDRTPEFASPNLLEEMRYAIVQRWRAQFEAGLHKRLAALTELLMNYGEAIRSERTDKQQPSATDGASSQDQITTAIAEAQAATGIHINHSDRMILSSVRRSAPFDREGEVRDTIGKIVARNVRNTAA